MRPRSSSLLLLCLTAAVAVAAVFGVQLAERPGAVVEAPELTPAFSPDGEGPREATISFRLREPEPLTVTVLDEHGAEVTRLRVPSARGRAVTTRWDGTTAGGSAAPEGTYRIEVELRQRARRVQIPSSIELDRTAPGIAHAYLVRIEDDRNRFVLQTSLDEPPRAVRLQTRAGLLAPLRRRRPTDERGAGSWDRVRLWFPLAAGRELPEDARLLVTDAAGNSSSAPLTARPDRPAR